MSGSGPRPTYLEPFRKSETSFNRWCASDGLTRVNRATRPSQHCSTSLKVEAPGVEPFTRARKFFRCHEDLPPMRRVFTKFGSGVSHRFEPARSDRIRSV